MCGKSDDFKQIIGFIIVGITNTLVSYVFNIATLLSLRKLEFEYDYIIANIVAFGGSVLWSFKWNNKYVFKVKNGERRSVGKAIVKTYISYAFTGIFLNNVLLWIWIEKADVSKYLAPFFNPVITICLNFVLSKFWVFKSIESDSEVNNDSEKKV